MRPDPPDLPARLKPAGTLDAGGLQEATLSDAHLDGLQAPGVKIDACVLDELIGCRLQGIRGATGLRGVSMRWDDVLANAGVFAAACGVTVTDA